MKQDLRFLLSEPFGGLRKETLDENGCVDRKRILTELFLDSKSPNKN